MKTVTLRPYIQREIKAWQAGFGDQYACGATKQEAMDKLQEVLKNAGVQLPPLDARYSIRVAITRNSDPHVYYAAEVLPYIGYGQTSEEAVENLKDMGHILGMVVPDQVARNLKSWMN